MPRRGPLGPRDLTVIQRTYDLVLWFVPRLAKLPRTHRHGIGDVLTRNLYALLQGLVEARYERDRARRLGELQGLLDAIRYQCRMLRDLELLDLRRYEFSSRGLVGIGKELGGWRRSLARSGTETRCELEARARDEA